MDKILTIDDNKDNLKVISIYFKEMGYEPLSADNGVDGVELFKENSKDITLVLCDYLLPEKDGIQAISEIKAINPNTICYLITGHSNDADFAAKAYEKGADLVIYKPFRLNYIVMNYIDDLNSRKQE